MLTRRLTHDLALNLPALPAELDGLRIAHLTDLHISWARRRHHQIVHELAEMAVDLILFTGDYMSNPGDEPAAIPAMRLIAGGLQARLGVFAVWGNHDSPELRRSLADLPVRWINDQCVRVDGLPLEILGIDTDARLNSDSMAMLSHWNALQRDAAPPDPLLQSKIKNQPSTISPAVSRPLRILLSHMPTFLPSAGDLAIDLMFSGHTHGGQCRLPRGRVLTNSCDLPLHLSSGILRHQHTVCIISRGLGEIHLPWRFLCPAHLPVVTLRRGPLPGRPTHHVENVQPW